MCISSQTSAHRVANILRASKVLFSGTIGRSASKVDALPQLNRHETNQARNRLLSRLSGLLVGILPGIRHSRGKRLRLVTTSNEFSSRSNATYFNPTIDISVVDRSPARLPVRISQDPLSFVPFWGLAKVPS